MQCASSIAKKAGGAPRSIARNPAVTRRSGATYRTLRRPAIHAAVTRPASSAPSVLLRHAAGIPHCVSAVTWSCMSEMSGDTTTAHPKAVAGA